MDLLNYIGKAWHPKGDGTNGFDCWTLIVDIYKNHLGKDLPFYQNVSRKETDSIIKGFQDHIDEGWIQIEKPFHLCAVALSKKEKFIHHCGVIIVTSTGKFKVLHAKRDASGMSGMVVLDDLSLIKSEFKQVKYYALYS